MSIDYQEIIEQLDDNKVKSMLDKLGIPYQDKGNCLIMPTVCHHADIDEASWKLYYYKNTHIFQCFTECGAMSIFNFLNIEERLFFSFKHARIMCSVEIY